MKLSAEINATCDDGWDAAGFRELIEAAASLGLTVNAGATEIGYSSMGTATGISDLSELESLPVRNETIGGVQVLVANTFPATMSRLLTQLNPHADMMIAGINPGPNIGTNLIHSGTVGLALSANCLGVKSLAISLDDVWSVSESSPGVLRFDLASEVALRAVRVLLQTDARVFVNVNVPNSITSPALPLVATDPLAINSKLPSDHDVLSSGKIAATVFHPRSFDPNTEGTKQFVDAMNSLSN